MNDVINFEVIDSLFPREEKRDDLLRVLQNELQLVRETMRDEKVTAEFDYKRFSADLSRFNFVSPIDLTELLRWTVQHIRQGCVQITHPRYFGLFNPSPAFPSILADYIAATLNPQLAAAKTSPAAVSIEAHVIKQISYRAGLPNGSGGHFTNSGSEANFTALICALTKICPSYKDMGIRALRTPPAIYISKDAHQAWFKIAHEAGIGRLAIRAIETDGRGQMSLSALSEAVSSDKENGAVPIMVVATAGTTIAGMVDPIHGCAEIAEKAGAWFHVDAAWGGAAIASDILRSRLSGIELADSITIDAHKWFSTTMGCGMFLTSQPWVLNDAFNVSASFMPSSQGISDPYTSSVQWSRRFSGLRLFLNLASAGWSGYARHVERTLDLANILAEKLKGLGWDILNPQALGVVCITPPAPHSNIKKIVNDIVSSGEAWVAFAVFEGIDVIRICITNGETTADDVDVLVDVLQRYSSLAVPEADIAKHS